jgi:hypothetical protein
MFLSPSTLSQLFRSPLAPPSFAPFTPYGNSQFVMFTARNVFPPAYGYLPGGYNLVSYPFPLG